MGRTPVDKERIQNLEKQTEIADALQPYFFNDGFSNASTSEICHLAGKSKATIYKYFESKEEIISFITARKLMEIQNFDRFLNDEKENHATRYKLAVRLVVDAFDGISFLFLNDLKKEYPHIFQMIFQMKNASIDLLKIFYLKGIEAGEFRGNNADLLASNDDLFFTAILETDFLSRQKHNLKELFEIYFEVRFHGLLA